MATFNKSSMAHQNSKPTKPKAIQFLAKPETATKVDKVAAMLRSNRAGVVELAVETISDLILSGGASVVNGQVEFTPKAA